MPVSGIKTVSEIGEYQAPCLLVDTFGSLMGEDSRCFAEVPRCVAVDTSFCALIGTAHEEHPLRSK